MKYEFAEYLKPTPIIQQKKKYATFTIKEIGGPAELAKWKIEQAAKWEAYQANRAAFKEKQKQFIAGPEAPEGNGVTWAGKGSATGLKTEGTWQDKLQAALEARKELRRRDPITPKPVMIYQAPPEPKLSLWGRVKKSVRAFWDSANF